MKVKPANRTESVQEYYFSRKLKQIDEMRSQGADIINLGIGSPDQMPSKEAIEALSAEAAKPGSHGYQSYIGIPALRQAFADWYKKYFGVSLDPASEILPLAGSKEGIMHISMAFVNSGDEVLVPDPGYPTYSSVTNLVGGKIKYYPLTEKGGWLPDFTALRNADLSGVKIMWVNYPHMPSGTKGNMATFDKLIKLASDNNFLIINDNPYSFILNREYNSILAADGAKEVALELNSLSKSQNMAGWRIGMLAGHREYVSSVLKVKSNMDSGIFRALQVAAVEALKAPDKWYESVNEVYSRRKIIVNSIMSLLGCSYSKDQAGLFVWGRLPDHVADCESFVENILQTAHVFVTPGFIFGNNGSRYIRISLCADEIALNNAKERIEKMINSQK